MKMSVAKKYIQQIIVFDIFVVMFVTSLGYSFVLSSEVGDGKIKCLNTEKEALLRFKELWNDRISSWGNEQDCCRWSGVHCDNQTSNVIGLDLHGDLDIRGVEGTLSPALLELKHLKYLDLSYSNIQGDIPEFVGSLSKLEYLNLSCVSNSRVTLPPNIGNLSSLKILDLSGNMLEEVPPHIGNLSSLSNLDLNGNYFLSFDNLEWISGLGQLKYLAMDDVNLSNATDWLEVVHRLPFLQVLSFSSSKLPAVISSVFPPINSSTSLSELDLSSNNLNTSIYTWLFNFTNLVELDLSGNALNGHIPEAFWNMLSLQHLDLSDNALEGGFPICFRNICNLKLLQLSHNRLDGLLLGIMKNLSCATGSLEYLNLESNHIGGSLPDMVANFSSLRELRLGLNELNGSIPGGIEELSSLVILDLSWNEFVGSVPNLVSLSSLRELDLSNNQLTGLTKFVGHLPRLEKLYLASNQFQGVISEVELFKLFHLSEMDLSFNAQLHIQISSNWIPPFQLKVIGLSHCRLGPQFPNWLLTQSNISVLDLSVSGISGDIPSWFWDRLTGLHFLNFSYNHISGSIPDFSRKMSVLRLIDLGSNNFSGPIPPQFPPKVTTVDLSKNKFSGPITFVCDDLGKLGYLDLSNNLLSGELPRCWKLSFLVRLNLANNNFSGKISGSLSQNMRILQLRNNRFVGELPQSLENCKMLKFIDVGENNLSGKIPAWIGNLSYIIAVILKSNGFSGSIPSSICQLKWIQILDVSQNKISGSIPKCISNLTALTSEKSPSQTIHSWYWSADSEDGYNINTSYDASANLMWKGREFEYSSILGLVKSIDLSSNELVGEIPVEITSLEGLLGLNLSRNNLTGTIPPRIGQLRVINFLDLSRNKLSGEIPASFSEFSHLGVLDLSFNNLSGRIPIDTQSQTFNASSYAGNPGLCGSPLTETCPGDKPRIINADSEDGNEEHEDEFISTEFYIGMGIGFVFGFWGVCSVLILNKTWRYALFRFLDNILSKY